MSAQSTKQRDVIAIRHLDTAALRHMRAAVATAPRIAPASSAPIAVTVRPPAPVQATRGGRMATATFALGLLLGMFATHLGETRPTALPIAGEAASPPVLPVDPPPPPLLTTQTGTSNASIEVLRAPPPLAERATPPEPAKPAHRHHGS